MRLDEVQSYVADRIKSDPTLAAFGDPFVFSLFLNEDELKKDIAERLRTTGVAIEIGSVEADGDASQPNTRETRLRASFEVFVAESLQCEHEPRELPLVSHVAAVIQKRVSAYEHNPRCVGYGSAISEQGVALHILSFVVPCIL